MIIKTSALALAGLALVSLQPARAEPYYGDRSDIRRDIREVRQDRATVREDEARVARERAELDAARAQERNAFRRGDAAGVARAYEQEQREARELSAAQRKLNADRGKLNHDSRDLQRDLHHHRRFWWWG